LRPVVIDMGGKADGLHLIDVRQVPTMAQASRRVERLGDRLTLIGTIHVDPASAATVRDTIQHLRPEVVALEIDQSRLYALQNPGLARVSTTPGISFLAMVLLEKFAGQLTGSAPGTDMLYAVGAARHVGARIELVDLPVHNTISGLRRLPLRERFRLAVDSIASLILLPFGKADFSSLTENIGEQLQLFRSRYPSLSRLLLDAREDYMVTRIKRILDTTTGQVVVVVGFGHLASLSKRLAGYGGKPAYSTSLSWSLSVGN